MPTINFKNRAEVTAAVRKWPDVFQDEITLALSIMGDVVKAHVVARTPVYLGALAGGVYVTDPSPTPQGWHVGVGDDSPYGEVIEKGRSPNSKPPPLRAIIEWVWLHRRYWPDANIETEEDCVGIALRVRAKIGKRGFSSAPDGPGKGWGMYEKARVSSRGECELVLAAARNRIESRLNSMGG